jgi:uncharacterized protein
MHNANTWFEIPAADFDRAVRFYSAILNAPLRTEVFMGTPNAFFPADRDGAGGAVVQGEGYVPAQSGTVIYLNADGHLDEIVSRIEPAGGKVLNPRIDIGDPGLIAFFIDSEGNKVGLHQPR